ncbi:ABC transporter permease [Treponema sp. Marseille-Q3903]|uniref:ABC transporter permease n=1 Tax=Treponema sp. Marseille-Q3903 TaxID=2766703 RepID=UPI0016529EB2|nr:ABC transporter permease [Treponema sp. Marseille-Q3903]MBC6713401.1 ABC transporter permease [Treponema sp. Marseille-Q3903]
MATKNLIDSIRWISFVSKRFARVDRKGRSAVTSFLATLGICFGVMTLIVVMSVMNGFQMSFIDSILEVSSYHIRVADLPEAESSKLYEECGNDKKIRSVTSFKEAQALMTGEKGGANSVVIRAVDDSSYDEDLGFRKEVRMLSGSFNFDTENSIILGSTLANNLGVKRGDKVNLLVMSGGSDVDLFSEDRQFTVVGVFSCGYSEINSSYAFVSIESAEKYFGESSKYIYGIKIKNFNDDMHIIAKLKTIFPDAAIQSWRAYNRTFFGALRIEKNILLLLVALIFVVVAINIYNGMRRLVFERRSETVILSALGAFDSEVKAVFVMRGFFMGSFGAFFGVVLGLLISYNTDVVFLAAAKILYLFQYIGTMLTNSENLQFLQENSSYSVYAAIPARVFPLEVVEIAFFGMFSPIFASFAASKNVLKSTVSEVLHYE